MRYLILLLPLVYVCACDDSRDTTCYPSFSPGTAAYRHCLLRNGQNPAATQSESSCLHPQFLRSQ